MAMCSVESRKEYLEDRTGTEEYYNIVMPSVSKIAKAGVAEFPLICNYKTAEEVERDVRAAL